MRVARKLSKSLILSLLPLERLIAQKYGEIGINKYPPVFIIGAPRSGTTLLYKVLIENFNLGYISNLGAHFYPIPIVSTWLLKSLFNISYKKGYEFEYGLVPGLGSPSEFGEFWYQWFPKGKNIYVASRQTPQHHLKQLRLAIGGISYVIRMPFIFKNVYNSMRIAPICEAIHNARFLVCKRDYLETAISILNARKKITKDLSKWWSLPPKEVDSLIALDYPKQIAGQIYYTYRQIDSDRLCYGKDKFLEINYEQFCRDVPGTLEIISYFLERNGPAIEYKGQVPRSFEVSKAKELNNKERKKMLSAIDFYLTANFKTNEQQRNL